MSFDPVVLSANLALVDEMYARYQADRRSVDPIWQRLFSNGGGPTAVAMSAPAAAAPSRQAVAQAAVDIRTGL
jgi:2-oxoglutarate dehydrogenase complex dehydrogenase (E1) component-like enzyme